MNVNPREDEPRPGDSLPRCRFCGAPLEATLVDLGKSPLCESFLSADQLNQAEVFYPLHVHVCQQCFLVQLQEYVAPEHIFTDYAYFSSYSSSWLDHARRYVEMAIERFALTERSLVVELASNDGYLLQYFVHRGVPVLGVEPAENVAAAAREKGVETRTEFFGVDAASAMVAEGYRPNLIVGNNVLAQVPDLNDFVEGMKVLLTDGGVITMEFPHLVRLIEGNQFDTIYHEHFSYFSLTTAEQIFAAHGLVLFDVEELTTHGGSIRIYARHANDTAKEVTERVERLLDLERTTGVTTMAYYSAFETRVKETKRKLLSFLIDARSRGKTVVGYGAPGKGNTLLNYCGIRTDLLDYTVDRNPFKHGKFLPGTHIPIFEPSRIEATKPDYILILPWNLRHEIMSNLAYTRGWGAKFVVPIPEVTVYD